MNERIQPQPRRQTLITRRHFLASLPLTAALPASLHAADAPGPRVACQTNAWGRTVPEFPQLLDRLAVMKRLGYKAFECNFAFVQGQFASAAQARKQFEQAGVGFYGPHIGLKQVSELLEALVEGAAALGAKQLALSGAGGVVSKDGKLNETALVKKVDDLTRVAARCHQSGLRLAYHNHREEFVSKGAEIEELLRRTDPDKVSLLFDIGHAYREGTDITGFFEKHHSRINAMHLRDIRGAEQVPLGQGEVNLATLGAAVRKSGWRGWLTIEEENLGKNIQPSGVEEVLKIDRAAIRKFFGV